MKPNLPPVEKRTFKVPDNFPRYNWFDYDQFEHYYNHDVEEILIDTENKFGTLYVSDIFYRRKGKKEWIYGYSFKRQCFQTKYPCIGGPLDGTKAIIGTDEYSAYNRSGGSCDPKDPKCVLVHQSLLR